MLKIQSETLNFRHLEQDLVLLPEKGIYWQNTRSLLLADCHLGKATHFRKSGIPIPSMSGLKNLEILQGLIEQYAINEIYFLGDLFHSELNTEWLHFKEFVKNHDNIRFHLILGNHDILHGQSYKNSGLIFHSNPISLGPYILSHEPLEKTNGYNLCGHIHPGVRLKGKARMSLRAPCYFFGKNQAILPAFGQFTGLHILEPTTTDQVFVVAQNKVIEIS